MVVDVNLNDDENDVDGRRAAVSPAGMITFRSVINSNHATQHDRQCSLYYNALGTVLILEMLVMFVFYLFIFI